MSLPTPITIRALQRKLYLMAKRSHEHRVEALGNAVTLATSRDQRFRDPYECAQWCLHALRKNLIREPDAGNPHVRFDERDVETEYGSAREAPANERAGKQIGRS